MNYAPAQQINTARHIARAAQRQIKYMTGISIKLVLFPAEHIKRKPGEMLEIIARALDNSPCCYKMKSHRRDIAELRFIAALLLRRNFPEITLKEIAALFGGQDHSTIISGLTRANNLITTGDMRFIQKYNTALKSVNVWLKKDA